ncbi:MAG: hypothetical protein L0227_04120 [Chloroflexi bacterium]|nr:hypothetical protein [Chloroflexota bacterium]
MPDQTEPRDAARLLQILIAEHASLTAMRTQSQSEMASRATMFVAALSGGLVAISFIAQATRFGPESKAFDLTILTVLLFVGVATFVRTLDLNADDVRWVAALNRLRGAYIELEPASSRYLVTARADDAEGIQATINPGRSIHPIYGLAATPGLIAVIDGVIGGAIAGVISTVIAPSIDISAILAIGALGFAVVLGSHARYGARVFGRAVRPD